MDYLILRYLSHSGVKGQKWGIRRYQNADGSLTPEGRIHYGVGELNYNSRFNGTAKEAKKAFKAEKNKLYKKLGSTNYSDENKVGLEASLKYERDYNKKHKDIRNKILKSTGFDIDKDENQDLNYDLEALEMLVDEHNKNSKDKLGVKDVDYYFNKESNPDDWDVEWEKQQNEIISKNYDSAKKYVDGYLSSKYGQETINSIKRDTKLKGEAIALATIGTGLLITSVVGINKIKKDRKQRAANEANATPDIDDMLAKEASESGMSDDEFNNSIRNLNATKKYSNARDAAENLRESTRDTADTYGRVADKAEDLEKLAKKFRNQVDNF